MSQEHLESQMHKLSGLSRDISYTHPSTELHKSDNNQNYLNNLNYPRYELHDLVLRCNLIIKLLKKK